MAYVLLTKKGALVTRKELPPVKDGEAFIASTLTTLGATRLRRELERNAFLRTSYT